jgi:hypothetical protein
MPGAKAGVPVVLLPASAGLDIPLARQAKMIVLADAVSAPMVARRLSRTRSRSFIACLLEYEAGNACHALESAPSRTVARHAMIVTQVRDGTREVVDTEVGLSFGARARRFSRSANRTARGEVFVGVAAIPFGRSAAPTICASSASAGEGWG